MTYIIYYVGATVDIFSDDNKQFKGLYFQDNSMKQCFHAYPEVVFLDATYKLLEIGIPIYLLLCEDSNGTSEIVFVCLLVKEDHESIIWMMETFKKRNEFWYKIGVVMADKDIGERDAVKSALPTASVLICLFHALRTFRREVSCEKLGITSGQRTLSLEIFQKMAYCCSEGDYFKLYTELRQSAPKQVVEYFRDNWHDIKSEWVLHYKAISGSFLNSTNNRLESINGKLKQVISRHSSLESFIKNFFIIISALRGERNHKAAIAVQKIRVQAFDDGSPEKLYSQLLTHYASDYVLKQLGLVHKVKIKKNGRAYIIESSEGVKQVSVTDCGCLFRKSMLLPCRHIFALRLKLKQPLFLESLCNIRWTSTYYQRTQRIFLEASFPDFTTEITQCRAKHSKHAPSQHQKYKKAAILTSELASLASEACGIHFHRRMELLKELIASWKCGDEVGLADVDHGVLGMG